MPAAEAESGRGLAFLDALADRWGVVRTAKKTASGSRSISRGFSVIRPRRASRLGAEAMALELYMVGVIVEDMPRAAQFYRRLGVDVPQEHGERGARRDRDERAEVLPQHQASERQVGPRQNRGVGGYRTVLEFYLETPAVLDAKYEELTGHGYVGHCAPYNVTPKLRFAMVDDPDGNTILLSASVVDDG